MRLAPLAIAALLAPLAAADPPSKPTKPAPAPPSPAVEATLNDITQVFGFVPQFMRAVPPAMLPGAWTTMKSMQMSNETMLDRKTKELIGLAVAAQIPCEYCIMFHTEAARLNGATDQELQEAVGMAAVTREFSTMLNGNQVDKVQFKRDMDRILAKAKQQAHR